MRDVVLGLVGSRRESVRFVTMRAPSCMKPRIRIVHANLKERFRMGHVIFCGDCSLPYLWNQVTSDNREDDATDRRP